MKDNLNFKTITKCRACNSSKLRPIISLGNISIVGFFASVNIKPTKVPLKLVLCDKCKLLQLKHTTNPSLLWNAEYGYISGINKTMRNELKNIARIGENISKITSGDIVIDIGCNDGTLLKYLKTKNIKRVGFDPSHNVISLAYQNLRRYGEDYYTLIVDFFSKNPYQKKFKKKAKLITAIAMFYDLDDPNTFLEHVRACLRQDGVFIIQQNYLSGMLKSNAFDNILHEHLEYYSLSSLYNLLQRHDLEVFDVGQNGINGGSFRTYIKHKRSRMGTQEGSKRVEKMLNFEEKEGLLNLSTYNDFAKRINSLGNDLISFLQKEVTRGKKIFIYGASTRGNTLLNYCKINKKLISAAAERNPYKWGKIIAGSGIPIISEDEAREIKPDYFLVLPWYFKNEFLEREKEYLSSGGKFIFPLPKFEVIGI